MWPRGDKEKPRLFLNSNQKSTISETYYCTWSTWDAGPVTATFQMVKTTFKTVATVF